ncbi:MAG: hypothetical protein Q7U58_20845, partial [Hydrogenophaga sp.]|nr:hypothetical protein [Hydrogenophaga sp.]
MSYILDALKRADAERERGHVPGLHTHNVQPSAATPPRTGGPTTAWLMTAVAAAALGGAAWWWMTAPAPNLVTVQNSPAPVQAVSAPPTPLAAAAPNPVPSV